MKRALTRHHVSSTRRRCRGLVKTLAHNGITVSYLDASIFCWRDVLAFELKRGTSA
jgi:hypothetical protein